ncbi:hypothetical protein DVH24_035565 [Malus domestica]|uniref:Uncharacterized protein n=1 Tax=Malus domestica TaxID=3750 RepID=A0A498JBR5_MALDO|nr:hypothetical protein DVH24_035565 [Malus domestica]
MGCNLTPLLLRASKVFLLREVLYNLATLRKILCIDLDIVEACAFQLLHCFVLKEENHEDGDKTIVRYLLRCQWTLSIIHKWTLKYSVSGMALRRKVFFTLSESIITTMIPSYCLKSVQISCPAL